MLQLVFLLLIAPAIIGTFIKSLVKRSNSVYSAFFFSLGFLIMVAEFALMCYPAIYLDAPFHRVCQLACGVYLFESSIILLWLILDKQINIVKKNKRSIATWIRSPVFWAMLFICGFQIIRLFVCETAEIRDSKSYSALIIDILQSDHLFRINSENGFPLASILDTHIKFILSPWYPFIAMLAYISRLHPLIVHNTVLPGYLLMLAYFFIYSLGYMLFEKNENHAFQFTAICAFIYELTLYRHTPTLIKLVWPVWGKGVLSMTVIPAVFVLFILYAEEHPQTRGFRYTIVLFLLVLSGCSMSTMAAVVLPLELGLLGIVWSVRHRTLRPLLCSIVSMIPSALYAFTYYYLSRL